MLFTPVHTEREAEPVQKELQPGDHVHSRREVQVDALLPKYEYHYEIYQEMILPLDAHRHTHTLTHTHTHTHTRYIYAILLTNY